MLDPEARVSNKLERNLPEQPTEAESIAWLFFVYVSKSIRFKVV